MEPLLYTLCIVLLIIGIYFTNKISAESKILKENIIKNKSSKTDEEKNNILAEINLLSNKISELQLKIQETSLSKDIQSNSDLNDINDDNFTNITTTSIKLKGEKVKWYGGDSSLLAGYVTNPTSLRLYDKKNETATATAKVVLFLKNHRSAKKTSRTTFHHNRNRRK